MVSICLFNSPPQYCLLSRWFFPDPKKVLWVSDSLHIVHNESSHLTRGPGSGLLSLLFWPLSMMLIVAPLRQRKVSFEPKIKKSCFAMKHLICLISLILLPLFPMTDPTTSLGTDISCLDFGSVFNVIKKIGIFLWKPTFLFKGYARPEVPISAIISPRPASSTSSGSPSKVCYCVERGTEK